MSLKRKRPNGVKNTGEAEHSVTTSLIDHHPETTASSLNTDQLPQTPSKKRRGRRPGSTTKPKSTPNSLRQPATPNSAQKDKKLFSTPSKAKFNEPNGAANSVVRDADRSARRKSAKRLIEQVAAVEKEDEDEEDKEDSLAQRIRDAEEADEGDIHEETDEEEPIADPEIPVTPSKKGRKGPRRKRTPTPPQDLPPHEKYFFQNRAGNTKTSNNTLSSLSLLSHEQYHQQINSYEDPHASSYAFLHSLHSRSFPQWRFELSQSFNICLYGYGSKRHLVSSFASYLHSRHPSPSPPKVVVTNGYVSNLTVRQILTTIATVVYDCPNASSLPVKLGTQPQQIIDTILNELSSSPPSQPIYLLINSLDGPPLRRSPVPSLLAQLASSPHIHLLATCDSPNFPLLWDTNLREQYNWLFHDATTYVSYGGVEVEDVVEEVNELTGRSGRKIKGKEGVGFVLRSLPENARALYRVLIAELLSLQDSGFNVEENVRDLDEEEADEDAAALGTPRKSRRRGKVLEGAGIEYRTLYQKVVEEFICSSEMGFRQLLKEFHDHQMINSRRDVTGAEMLGVPFRREEMEAILEDLME
ncbi:MAG: hypothetical protein Q9219_002351 [cf. Caloplaca sp. 3 TL-2023]